MPRWSAFEKTWARVPHFHINDNWLSVLEKTVKSLLSGIISEEHDQFLFEERLSDRLFSASIESKYLICEDNDCSLDWCDEEERTKLVSDHEEAEFTEYLPVSQNVEDGTYSYLRNKNGHPKIVKKGSNNR